jgi:hypothetical protein
MWHKIFRIICVKRHFKQYFSHVITVSFIDGGKSSAMWKPPTCFKSLTNFIIQYYFVYMSPSTVIALELYDDRNWWIEDFTTRFMDDICIQICSRYTHNAFCPAISKYTDDIMHALNTRNILCRIRRHLVRDRLKLDIFTYAISSYHHKVRARLP